MKYLINASNLHNGGGVQVASSFISELSKILLHDDNKIDVSVYCSQKVFDNLSEDCKLNVFSCIKVFNVYGLEMCNSKFISNFIGFDVCFTVFGPFYINFKVTKHICGFAQPWIAYPLNDVYPMLSFKESLTNKLKYFLQSIFFKRYDFLIVEQFHVKNALKDIGYNSEKILVQSNCVSSIYENSKYWLPLDFNSEKFIHNVQLGFIGRSYLHKNVKILSDVNEILVSKFQMFCDFIFTFSEIEMKSCGFLEKENFHSVGEINIAQCPSFYNLIDALIFPSLLECFSASPIEAMKMNTTVLASNYPFVSEVCGDSAFYFNPLCADSIAETIYMVFKNDELRAEKIKLGKELVEKLPKADKRAESYFNIMQNCI